MTRLEQAIAIRDALIKHCPDWHRGNVHSVRVPLPGFVCMLTRHGWTPDGMPFALEIYPDPDGTVLSDKVLHLAWGDYGRAKLHSIRKAKEWMDTLLATLAPDGGGKSATRRHLKVVK